MKEIIILFALVGVTAWACKKDSYMEERDVLGTAVAAATFSVSDLEGAISQAEARLLVHTFKQNIGMPSGGRLPGRCGSASVRST